MTIGERINNSRFLHWLFDWVIAPVWIGLFLYAAGYMLWRVI